METTRNTQYVSRMVPTKDSVDVLSRAAEGSSRGQKSGAKNRSKKNTAKKNTNSIVRIESVIQITRAIYLDTVFIEVKVLPYDSRRVLRYKI